MLSIHYIPFFHCSSSFGLHPLCNLVPPTLSSSTRSILCLPSGLMSLRINAMMMVYSVTLMTSYCILKYKNKDCWTQYTRVSTMIVYFCITVLFTLVLFPQKLRTLMFFYGEMLRLIDTHTYVNTYSLLQLYLIKLSS